jgi:hypothetical protein
MLCLNYRVGDYRAVEYQHKGPRDMARHPDHPMHASSELRPLSPFSRCPSGLQESA